MKLKKITGSIPLLCLAAMLLALSGCFNLGRLIVWSPDGKLACVLGDKGLYLCDGDGKISDLLVSNVLVAAWFGDSRRIAFAQERAFTNWGELEGLLPPEVVERIRRDAQPVLEGLRAGQNLERVSETVTNLNDNEKSALALYLKTVNGAREAMGTNWQAVEKAEFDLAELKMGTVTNGLVAEESLRARETSAIREIRVSPGQTAIAYVLETGELKVVPARDAGPARLVAEKTSLFPDWSPDGRSLLYFRTSNEQRKDEMVLGSLTRRGVLNERGDIELQKDSNDLAGVLFDPLGKVRCLPDGRIIFCALDVRLPCTTADMPQRQQLYALDPERQATLTPLIPQGIISKMPTMLELFEPSPDGKRVAMADEEKFAIFNIVAGTAEVITNKINLSETVLSWRYPDEVSFVTQPDTNSPGTNQVVLWKGGKLRAISTNWPDSVRNKLLD